MMWIALQVILGYLCLLPNFWPKKLTYLKKRKKHLDVSSFYTCIQKFLKNDADSITGYSWLIFALLFHFRPKIKIFKK